MFITTASAARVISAMRLSFGTNISRRVVTWLPKIQVSSSLVSPFTSKGFYEGKCQLSEPLLNQRKLITLPVPIFGPSSKTIVRSRYQNWQKSVKIPT